MPTVLQPPSTESELRLPESWATSIVHAVSHPLLVLRPPDLVIVEANRAYVAATALPRHAIIGRNFFEVFVDPRAESAPAMLQAVRHALDAAVVTGTEQSIPLVRFDAPIRGMSNGALERYWSMTVSPIAGPDGHVELLVLDATDVTDLQQLRRLVTAHGGDAAASRNELAAATLTLTESARLLDSERQLFLQLFQQAPGFIAVLSGPQHVTTMMNAAFAQLVGHRDLLGKPFGEALSEIQGQGFLEILNDVYTRGRAFVGRNLQAWLHRVPGGSADRIYIDLTLQPLIDEQGSVTGIFVQGIDVTERKLCEDAYRRANETLEQRVQERTAQLLASQEQMRLIFEYSTESHSIMQVHDDGTLVFEEANPTALALMQRRRNEVIGRSPEEVFGEELAAELCARLRECVQKNTPVRYEHTQSRRIFDVGAVPVMGGAGKPTRVLVSARDVTDSRMLEAQLRQAQKMEAVGQLTGGIAHDFNNLLTVIIGHLDRLERRLEDEQLRSSATMALESARKAAMLTHRLLAFSRKQPLDPKAIDVNALITDMSDMLKRTLGETIVVETILDPNLWTTSADPNQMENALLNLAVNARDAMPHGGRLTISTANVWLEALDEPHARQMIPGEYVRVSVRDTGVGMTPDVLARAFEPFFTTKEVGQGSGLGLPMIYGFIKQSGGHINIESEVDAGTTVNLYLPRLYDSSSPSTAVESPPVRHVGRKCVLAVEDDAAVRRYTVSALQELGHEVLAAVDGVEALQLLEAHATVDLLFTDLVLSGGMSGRELARLAVQRRPTLKVLYTTGYERGAFDTAEPPQPVLAKPFTTEQLSASISAVFEDAN